jgi:hypothetical protein
VAFVLLLVVPLAIFALKASDSRPDKLKLKSWLTVVFFSMLMMTRISGPVWSTVPVLKQMIYPGRFYVLLCVAAAALLGIVVRIVGVSLSKQLTVAISLGSVLVCCAPVIRLASLQQHRLASMLQELEENYEPLTQLWVKSRDPNLMTGPEVRSIAASQPDVVIRPAGVARVERWLPRRIDLVADSSIGTVLTLRHFYYPGWIASVEGKAKLLPITASPVGLIEIELPPGRNRILVELARETPEKAGNAISYAAAGMCIVLASFGYARRQGRPPTQLSTERL